MYARVQYNMSVASAPAYAAQSPSAMRPSAAYQAAGKPPKSAGSVGGSNPNSGMFAQSWDGCGAEGTYGSSPPGSRKFVVSGGGLSSSDVERLRQRAKRVRIILLDSHFLSHLCFALTLDYLEVASCYCRW